MEAASFVEKEPSKVAVRFIGQTLHYKRNHLHPAAKITAVHHKQNIFINTPHTVTMPHLITLVLILQPTLSVCKEFKGPHAGTAAFKGHN